ncbi:MAG: response regulator transcription factor [Sideroxydans sp.]|nr:response regulator transcription factor [Sideroxydans sp.]
MTPTRILLIDDHAMFRTGLRLVLEAGKPGAEIFEAASLDEATGSAPGNLDVVLLDIHLNGLNGLECIAPIQRKWPLVPILMLSSQDEPETVDTALSRGAAGFISKAETAERIVEAINLVLRGHFSGKFSGLSPEANRTSQRRLTPRQCEVLNLLHQGLSNKLIARQLELSDNTVRRHVQDILEYLHVSSRAEAVFAARNQGLIG